MCVGCFGEDPLEFHNSALPLVSSLESLPCLRREIVYTQLSYKEGEGMLTSF